MNPSKLPSMDPSKDPSKLPSMDPSKLPSMDSSKLPSMNPSKLPSMDPSKLPSMDSSKLPSMNPSKLPSMLPSKDPSKFPSRNPSKLPSLDPSKLPSTNPSKLPSIDPSKLKCTICDDVMTTYISENNLGGGCATAKIVLSQQCNKTQWWRSKKYCQLSCYNEGNGYAGDICCNSSMNPSELAVFFANVGGSDVGLPVADVVEEVGSSVVDVVADVGLPVADVVEEVGSSVEGSSLGFMDELQQIS